ncbi:MAG: NUDIX hydrolase [Paracoccaceae bacterium]
MKAIDDTTGNSREAMTQYAALCYRKSSKNGVEILLVTSRDTGRWVLPKGWPMKGRTGPESALGEAYEEAGVEGRISDRPIGLYSYDKGMDDGMLQPCVVTVYPVEVQKLRRKFPERAERKRRWFLPAKAARKVDEPELRELLSAFDLSAPPSQAGNGKA